MACSYALGCFQAKEEGDAEDEESEGKLEQRFVEADDFSVVWKSFYERVTVADVDEESESESDEDEDESSEVKEEDTDATSKEQTEVAKQSDQQEADELTTSEPAPESLEETVKSSDAEDEAGGSAS